MYKELRDSHDSQGKAEGNGGDGVQDVAQAFVHFEKCHDKSPFHDPPLLANEEKIGASGDFLGQVFESEA